MVETPSLGLRRQPDLFVVQREDLWLSCTLHMPLNSILKLQAPSVGRGAQGERRSPSPGSTWSAVKGSSRLQLGCVRECP